MTALPIHYTRAMARRGAPALYELMRPPGGGDSAAGGAAAPTGVPAGSSYVPRGGRHGGSAPVVFQVPLLWAVVLAIGVLLVLAITYSVGVSRGRAAAGAPAADASSADQSAGQGQPRSADPAQDTPGSSRRTATTPKIPATPAPDNTGDPRVKGYRYFVLAHPSSERAAGMVEFCRGNGLDAYLVPDDNALLRKIIVLPGYKDASERNSPEIKALEATIKRVGEKWKAASRGNKDFSDAFLEFYR